MNKYFLKRIYDLFRTTSIILGVNKIIKEWYKKLENMNIDITDQYSTFRLDTDYLKFNVRMMHAFQIQLLDKIIKNCYNCFDGSSTFYAGKQSLLDFGDSAGTHCQYIKKIWPQARTISANIDLKAVEKIRSKGLKAIWIKEIKEENVSLATLTGKVDYVIAFEVFEHLENPITVLKELRDISNRVVITIPYLEKSRIKPDRDKSSETCHIFELCPDDWQALFHYAGWEVMYEDIMYQYPRHIPLLSWLLKKYWQRYDFEGFYGIIIRR